MQGKWIECNPKTILKSTKAIYHWPIRYRRKKTFCGSMPLRFSRSLWPVLLNINAVRNTHAMGMPSKKTDESTFTPLPISKRPLKYTKDAWLRFVGYLNPKIAWKTFTQIPNSVCLPVNKILYCSSLDQTRIREVENENICLVWTFSGMYRKWPNLLIQGLVTMLGTSVRVNLVPIGLVRQRSRWHWTVAQRENERPRPDYAYG